MDRHQQRMGDPEALAVTRASDHHGLRHLENVGQIPAAPSAAVPDTLTPPARSWRATMRQVCNLPSHLRLPNGYRRNAINTGYGRIGEHVHDRAASLSG